MPHPQFIVIGAQKSASSFLQACLTEHPDIWMPDGETPYFESPDYEQQTPNDFAAIFTGRTEPMLGIKRPNYIGKPEVPARIASDCPDAHLIAVLRNPVDRAVSAYFHQIKSGFLPPIPWEKGLEAIIKDPEFVERHPRSREILEFGLYYKYLAQYQPFFDRGKLLVMLHEDILADPHQCVAEAYRFLGVPDEFVPERAIGSRPQAVVYQPTRVRLHSYRPRLLYHFDQNRTRMTGRTRNPLRIALASAIVGIDRVLLAKCLGNVKPTIPPTLRKQISAYYDQDREQLQNMLQRDLSAWK